MNDERRFNVLRGIVMASLLNSKEKTEMLNFITILEESTSKGESAND